jgi:hypothetical protein
MKKTCCIVVLILLATAVFAEVRKDLYTSEGRYLCGIEYKGNAVGLGKVNNALTLSTGKFRSLGKLTNGQWQCVRELLNLYQPHKRGDVYDISIVGYDISSVGIARTTIAIGVICEFTSSTEYTCWLSEYLFK